MNRSRSVGARDFGEQFDLATRSAIPVESCSIAAGLRPHRTGTKELADSRSQAGRGRFSKDPASTGLGDDILYAAKVACNDRSAARHAFEQYIGPALPRGGMHQHIRSCIYFGETFLGLTTQKTHAICDAK